MRKKKFSEFEKTITVLSKRKKIDIVSFDLENESEIEDGFIKIKKITNSVDILVNNAGINQMSLFQMTTIKTFRAVFEINFFSVVNFTQKILKLIKKNNFLKIINISSNAASLSDLVDQHMH